MAKNIIELNGKQYDAVTGQLVGSRHSVAAPARASRPQPKVIDGFVRVSHHSASAVHHIARPAARPAHAKQPVAAKPQPVAPKTTTTHRTAPHPMTAHQPEHPKTLMRHAVARPAASLKRRTKAITHTGGLVQKSSVDILPKLSVHNIDEDRLKRAQRIARSRLISRFGSLLSQPARTTPQMAHRSSAPEEHVGVPVPPIVPRQPSTDIFERAMAHANSHKQPAHRPAHKKHSLRHVSSVAASSLAIILIVGFIAYQNAASLQMRVASSRAGISATLPRWQPEGFSIGKFTYGSGTVAVDFRSNSSPRSFRLTQSGSNWDSQALLSDYVIPHSNSYQAIQAEGTTIYTYGDNNATWINGGIWYNLNTNGSLSTSQIVHLAASM